MEAVEEKVEEWRPAECGKLFGEVVEVNGSTFLKVKCQKCTKVAGEEKFHYLRMDAGHR